MVLPTHPPSKTIHKDASVHATYGAVVAWCGRSPSILRAPMPKGAPSASRVFKGGYGSRYREGDTTPSGRRRSSRRLTTAEAVCFAQQLELCCHHWELSTVACIAKVLEDGPSTRLFLAGTAVAAAAKPLREAVRDYIADKAQKLAEAPDSSRRYAICVEVRERVRAHAGPPRLMKDAPPEAPAPPRLAVDGWLDQAPPPRPRPPAHPDSRLQKRMELWNPSRTFCDDTLPEHTVVVFERAEGRVRKWRADNNKHVDAPPPVALLHALFHTDHVPTALTGSNDHYLLPR